MDMKDMLPPNLFYLRDRTITIGNKEGPHSLTFITMTRGT
ncbi:hypothetical protein CR513_53362, partial [Mucuna pruriens]